MKIETVVIRLCIIAGGFLLGGVMFSRILPQIFVKKDVCECSDDRNPGAANVFKAFGPLLGLLCLFCDMLKGFLPVFLAYRFTGVDGFLFSAVMAAPVLGHALGVFNHFHGGKCIATAFGEVVALLPVTYCGLILAVLYIVFSTALKIKPMHLRSIITFGLFAVLSGTILLYRGFISVALGFAVISVTAILKHIKKQGASES